MRDRSESKRTEDREKYISHLPKTRCRCSQTNIALRFESCQVVEIAHSRNCP
jgi:hypothetical protein